jgi:F-type H+-transporting ATPase subunit delta
MDHSNSKVSLVYARALFDVAKENAITDKVNVDIKKIIALLENDSDALYKMLVSPIMELEEKKKVLSKIFSGNVDALLLDFMIMLVTKDRFNYVGTIFKTYLDMVDDSLGIIRGEIKMPKIPDTEKRDMIISSIQDIVNKKVEAEFIEDKDLIAGFSARVGSYRLEYSFDSHLKEIEKKLIRG